MSSVYMNEIKQIKIQAAKIQLTDFLWLNDKLTYFVTKYNHKFTSVLKLYSK